MNNIPEATSYRPSTISKVRVGSCNKNNKWSNELTQELKQLVYANKPYHYFITLTFGAKYSFLQKCQFINKYIHFHNNSIFGRKYKNKGRYMTGFAFVEKHKSIKLEDKPHVHILVKYHTKYSQITFDRYQDKFKKAALTVLDDRDKHVFNVNGIHVGLVEDDSPITYCFKEIYDNKLVNFKIIGIDGLSDNMNEYDS